MDGQHIHVACNDSPLAEDALEPSGIQRLHLLEQGTQQYVKLDLKQMLYRITHSIGAQSGPAFSYIECPEGAVKASIHIDFSCTSNPFRQPLGSCTFEGDRFLNNRTAANSAILAAFSFLDQNCAIRVEDFSSKIEKGLNPHCTLEHLDQALASTGQVLTKFELLISACQNFCYAVQ